MMIISKQLLSLNSITIAAFLVVFTSTTQADVASDIANGLPSSVIVENASDLTYPELFIAAAQADQSQIPNLVSATITVTPDDTQIIVTAAIESAPSLLNEIIIAAIQSAPEYAPILVRLAIQYGANPDEIIALAIAASPEVDPTSITEAAAAGPLAPLPGTTNEVPTPSALSGTGGGGGNVASPS